MNGRNSGLRRMGMVAALAGAASMLGGCVFVVGGKGRHDWRYEHDDHQRRQRIGVYTSGVSESLASQLGIRRHRATLITRVLHDRPADEAGMQEFDVVVAINGRDSASPEQFRRSIIDTPSGEALDFVVLRQGEEVNVTVFPERR